MAGIQFFSLTQKAKPAPIGISLRLDRNQSVSVGGPGARRVDGVLEAQVRSRSQNRLIYRLSIRQLPTIRLQTVTVLVG